MVWIYIPFLLSISLLANRLPPALRRWRRRLTRGSTPKGGSVESREVRCFCARKRASTSAGADGGAGSSEPFVRILPQTALWSGVANSCQTAGRRRCGAGSDVCSVYAFAPFSEACRFPDLGEPDRH